MKKIIIVVLALLLLAVLSIFVLIMNFDVNQYKPEIIAMVKESTGRDFRIEGELSIEPSLIPKIVVEGVYFGNPAWAAYPDMVKIERFEAIAELLPLLDNQLKIKKIVLIRPEITLEKNRDGKANWQLELVASEEPQGETGVPTFDVEQISITDATLHYLEAGKEPQTVRLEKLSLGKKFGKPKLDLRLILHSDKLSARLEGKIGLFRHWQENQPYEVDLQGSLMEMDVALQARIQQPKEFRGIHIALDVSSSSTLALTDLAGAELPELGALSGRLVVDDTGTAWSADHIGLKYELSARLADLGISSQGTIGHLQEAREVAVAFDLAADSADLITKLAKREIAVSGAISLQGSLADLGNGIDSEDPGVKLDVKGGFADLSFSAAGQIGKLKQMRDVNLAISLKADSTEQLIKLSGQQLEPTGPLALQMQLADQDGTWRSTGLKLKLGRSDLAGDLQLNMQGAVPALVANLKSTQLDLTEFLPAPAEEKPQETKPGDKLFSSEPLPRDQLKQADIKLDLIAALFKTHQTELNNLRIGIDLHQGNLKVSPFKSDLLGGRMEGTLSISANSPDVDLRLKISGLEPTQMPKFKDGKEVQGAKTDMDLQIRGRGQSVAEIAATGNGLLKVKVGEGKLYNSGIELAGGDLLMGSISALNPLADKDPSTKLECATINFVIKDGIASNEKAFAVQTEKLNILGGGALDLRTEEIDITAKPKPREGIGLNLSGLAGAVGLGGTLANPAARADAVGVAKTAAKVGAALATGGLSILAEGLFDRATVDDTICEVVHSQKQASSKPGQTQTSSSKPAETKQAKDNPLEEVGSAIKGFFGQ